MYDHNQTLVPESFLALYARHGRPTASREEVEARHELAEDLALHIAAMPTAADDDDTRQQGESLELVRSGLLAVPAQVSPVEADWILRRVAELRGWPAPVLQAD